jgi:hypothetical protein
MIKIIADNESLDITKMYGFKLNYIAIYIYSVTCCATENPLTSSDAAGESALTSPSSARERSASSSHSAVTS